LNGYLLIELDLDFLRNEFLPELARRYFLGPQGHEYQAAVIDTNTQALVYDSSQPAGAAGEQSVAAEHGVAPLHSAAEFLAADVRTNLVWERRDYVSFFAGGDDPGRPAPPQPEFASPGNPFEKTPGGGGFRGPRTPAFLIGLEDEGWQLAVKHREGSLDSAVASLRRRNLGISFGILVLLAVSVGMIFVSAQRARRLADLQMEFVAGVSHELRTPLAVIRSAADNLADGVVKSAPQVQEYGSVIGREGRRLSTMIEQTLHFAATQTGAKTYELGEVSAEAVIARTLHDLQPAVEEAGFRVETSIEPGLPPVRSNAEALSRLLANLVQNALKYGGDAKWMAVRALTRPGNGKRHVEVRVDDHGPGIDPDDLPHIFEPFYRGKLALSNQIQGSGLGLNLAQRISQAVGASLTVESHPGKGSSFSVRLPVDEDGVPQRLS
jgi:signal transduction histidine kinase